MIKATPAALLESRLTPGSSYCVFISFEQVGTIIFIGNRVKHLTRSHWPTYGGMGHASHNLWFDQPQRSNISRVF